MNGFDVPLEFLHKGIFCKLLVKVSFKASNSDVVQISQIRIYSLELSDTSASDELSVFEQNAIEEDKEQIFKYVENIRKIDNTSVVYLGISLRHNTIHFEKLTEEQYNELLEVLYNELRETKQCKQEPKQELSQDQIIARRKELQKQLNEIKIKYNKQYETEMRKIEAEHKIVIRNANALYDQRRTDLRKRIETDERNETKTITDELERLKQNVKPTPILTNEHEELIKSILSILSDSM
jgi:hypothetical protein